MGLFSYLLRVVKEVLVLVKKVPLCLLSLLESNQNILLPLPQVLKAKKQLQKYLWLTTEFWK